MLIICSAYLSKQTFSAHKILQKKHFLVWFLFSHKDIYIKTETRMSLNFDVAYLISLHLSEEDILNLCLTSKSWRRLLNRDYVFRTLHKRRDEQFSTSFSKEYRDYVSTFNKIESLDPLCEEAFRLYYPSYLQRKYAEYLLCRLQDF